MLANATVKTENVWKTIQELGYVTYIPSALLLLMTIENGWDIVEVESVPSWDQLGFVYVVMLKCTSGGQNQKLIMPKSALVEKILAEHGPTTIPA